MAVMPFARDVTAVLAGDGTDFALNNPAVVGAGVDLDVVIPMWWFSGLFGEETLIPPSLISGAQFTFSLERAQRALSIISNSTGGLAIPPGFDDAAGVFGRVMTN